MKPDRLYFINNMRIVGMRWIKNNPKKVIYATNKFGKLYWTGDFGDNWRKTRKEAYEDIKLINRNERGKNENLRIRTESP
jgi:hypothetical protein